MADLTPTPKITAAGVTGAVTYLLGLALAALGVTLPTAAATAIAILATCAAGYLVPDHTSPANRTSTAPPADEPPAPPPPTMLIT